MTDSAAPAWLRTERLGDGVTAISEPGYANFFLIEGDTHAVLFDTGTGVCDMWPLIRQLTRLPVIVVNSHAHFDHRGGNQWMAGHAERILVHPAGQAAHERAVPDELLRLARTGSEHVEAQLAHARAQDTLHAIPLDVSLRPIPDVDWHVPAVAPTGTLGHGDVIDLGGRRLIAVHTPGHTADSLCLFDPDRRLLFAGDTVLDSDYFVHLPGADLPEFIDSLGLLSALRPDRVMVGHNLHPTVHPHVIAMLRSALVEVVAGRLPDHTLIGPYGVRTSRYDFTSFRLLGEPVDRVQTPEWELWE